MEQEYMEPYLWVKVEPGIFRVWGYWSSIYLNQDGTVRSYYFFGSLGKARNKLRQVEKFFETKYDCEKYFYDKDKDKREKGYVPLNISIYDKYVENNDIFGLIDEIKKVYKEWKYL